jgi:glycosyltransferase involved in cell wall biosynthesis
MPHARKRRYEGGAVEPVQLTAGAALAIAVCIPALNEEENLPLVLADLSKLELPLRVVVVDNGSTDRTAEVARAGGVEVVREDRRGYGSACLAGLAHLATDPPEIVVILDADYSDYPEDLPMLAGPILEDRADMVLGERVSRALPGALLPQQRYGNTLACTLIARVTGHRYADMGPFRALRWSSLERLQMEDTNYGWNVEMQIKAVTRGLRVLEVPVGYRKRPHGRSKIAGSVRGTVKAGVKIIYSVARYRE